MSDAMLPVRVVFVLLPDSLVLDWAGPAEALRIANQLLVASGRPARFRVEFAGPSPSTRSSVGVQIAGQHDPNRLPERYVPNCDRARTELGLEVRIPLEDAIARTAAWHRRG